MNSSTLIQKARTYCEQRGARFTPLRAKVYEILVDKHGPMGAYDMLDALKETESSAKPATVYRALDFLLDFGLIHRLESTNAFVACYHFGCHHPVQFLICDSCGDVAEIQSEGLKETLDNQAQENGFKVIKQTIEAHGLCAECQNAEVTSPKEHANEC
ncbi:transcriptional repressor [Alteromonas sp. KUL49]|uniref:transcriptional repressor n=1 Tax=Alteromonas sp. KUL49 TaxID=2480798 RepID=UPI00102ED582|nr:transcriptional repressor [Alteromonas sp. KUL49]TAP42416.1 transcriptional repressor [Alteromonas sp. KUL49]GEA10038.1 transcriptional repressor [Alteromonas sp. KUL49]